MSVPVLNELQIQVATGASYTQVTDGTNSANLTWSNGTPEGNVTAPPGSLCQDITPGAGALWIKVTGTGNTGWSQFSTSGSTNLSLANQTETTYDILSDTGNDVTVPQAVASSAALAGDGTAGALGGDEQFKLDQITVTQAVDLDAMETDISEHQTLLGVADGSTDFGTFTGTTISDNVTGKVALQELETAVEGKLDTTLNDSLIFVGNASNVATGVAMSGDGSINNTGALTIVSATDAIAGKVELNTPAETLAGSDSTRAVTAAGVDGYFTALVGNTTGVQHLGTFSGTTISDNVPVKTALQELETFVEAIVGGLHFAGTWDATTADPTGGMANQTYLRVSTAGTTPITTVNKGVVNSFAVGDWVLKDNAGNVHHIDNTDPALSLLNSTSTTLDVSNGGSSVTLPAAVASSAAGASDGSAGLLSDDDKFKLDSTNGYAESYGDGATTAYTITHNLGTLDVQTEVYRVADGVKVIPQVAHATVNTLTITHSIAPTANQYRVVVSRTAIA